MLSLLTYFPASSVTVFSSLESNHAILLKILQWFPISWMKSAIFCMMYKILQGIVPPHPFSLISRHSPRLHPLKGTCFSSSCLSLNPKSCLCPSHYLVVLFYAYLEPIYSPFKISLNLGNFPSTPLPTLKYLLSSHRITPHCNYLFVHQSLH